MAAGARQTFQLFRQITWFPWSNRALYLILHYSINNYQIIRKWVSKSQFYLNHEGHLKFHESCVQRIYQKAFFYCVNIYFFWIIAFVQWKKFFSIDCVNIYLFSIFLSIDFALWKSVRLSHLVILWFIN